MSRHRKKIKQQSTGLGAGLVLGVILGCIFLLIGPQPSRRQQNTPAPLSKPAPTLPGHWLKTMPDKDSPTDTLNEPGLQGQRPLPEADKFSEKKKSPKAGLIPPEEIPAAGVQEEHHLNKTLNNLNILYLWTDDGQLKVLSIMSINRETKEAALVVIPRFTRIEAEGRNTTINRLFKDRGRQYLANQLEKIMEIKIPNYLNVDQQAVIDISKLVGPLNLKGEKITILEAFEQTRSGQRTDDQDVVRAVAGKIVNPKILLKLPEIIWIFTHDVKTNLGTEELLAIYRVSRESKVTEMRKIAMPGKDIFEKEEKYRLVSKDTWQNIFYDLTK